MTTVAAAPTCTTRQATGADVPCVVDMFESFRASSIYATYGPAHPDVSTGLIERLIAGLGVVFVMEQEARLVGMIGLLVSDHPMTGERFATELFWWVEPAHRGRGVSLLRRAEAWAAEQGAVRLLMVSPAGTLDVDRIYTALGYAPVETSWQKSLAWFDRYAPRPPRPRGHGHGVLVHDDVLPDPGAYRMMALAQRFHAIQDGPVVFQRMAPCADPALPMWIVRTYPQLTPTLSFFRQGEADQVEPHYIHSDASMGTWTGIFYVTPSPPMDDGTVFWRHGPSGAYGSMRTTMEEAARWGDETAWHRWETVQARFNRLVLFPAPLYHSRAIRENYGNGDDARLIQVVFGTGRFP